MDVEGNAWLVDRARAASSDPAAGLDRADASRVSLAIEWLPAREREVLVLKEFEELTYREIA